MLRGKEYVSLLTAMKSVGLALSLASKYSVDQLNACCDRLEADNLSVESCKEYGNMQSAMVENPDAINHIRQLFEAGMSAYTIEEWLKAEKLTGCRLQEHSVPELAALFQCSFPSMEARQEYALYFMPRCKDDAEREVVIANIRGFYNKLGRHFADMRDEERGLFTHAFLHECLAAVDPKVFIPRLTENENIVNLLEFLFAEGVRPYLAGSSFDRLSALTEDMFLKFVQIYDKLGSMPERMERFLMIWIDNGGVPEDLDTFFRKAHGMTGEQMDAALDTRLAYLSTLYGSAVGNIPFQRVPDYAFQLVAYAITRRQNTFLRLIEANFDLFYRLPYKSMLFDETFYRRIRLNSINLKNLRECQNHVSGRNDHKLMDLRMREYTFDELKTLYDAPRAYITLYNHLNIGRTDDRLLTLRQMLKRELLTGFNEDQIVAVAARLSEKPFGTWKDSEFAHITGLTPGLCVRLLAAYDSVGRFVPDIHTANEASFLLRHKDKLDSFADWRSVRNNVEQIDAAWVKLRRELQLDDAFVHEHEQEILDFLYQEGASIAMTYLEDTSEEEGYKRIIRALLMGKYAELKYHADDLVKEIGYEVTASQKAAWMKNLTAEHGKLVAGERDDFYTIMRIGELPLRTCLNYENGAHRECLLACFDSNKKFLYAAVNGRPVARAMLRLTKGSARKPGLNDEASLQFADLRYEDKSSMDPINEGLVLFLERSYVSGLGKEEERLVNRMFITLAMRKAQEIGATVVLSSNYRETSADMGFTAMQHYLYISKSKGGKQYLDSLGGSCNVTNEGSYRRETVMMLAAREDGSDSDEDKVMEG